MKLNWTALGGALAFVAIALGAFGAHGLEKTLDAHHLDVFKTGAYYHLVHALGLILIGLRIHQRPTSRLLPAAGVLLTLGIVLFSGTLYLFTVTSEPRWAMITPLGGLSFMAGWIIFCVSESISNDKST